MLHFFYTLATVLALLFTSAPVTKEYDAQRFDVFVDVQADGTLIVTETVTFSFSGGPFTRVFRELAPEKVDRITVLSAGVNGETWPRGEGSGQVELSGREVVWHLPPTSDQVETFELTYRVEGVVQQTPTADLLVWQALPEERDYAIGASTVTVAFPGQAILLDQPTVQWGTGALEVGADYVTLTARDMGQEDLLILRLRFEPGTVIDAPPQWQVQDGRAQAWLPFFLGVGTVILLLGILATVLYVRRYRPQRVPAPVAASLSGAPPDDLPPGLVAALTASGAQPGWNGAVATLFALARRGVVTLSQTSEKQRWYQSPSFQIELHEVPSDLLPHQECLLEMLFHTKEGWDTAVELTELATRYSRHAKQFTGPLQQELDAAGWIDPVRQRARSRLVRGGLVVFLLGIALVVATALVAGPAGLWAAMVIPAGLSAAGLAMMIGASFVAPLSDVGLQERARWRAFAGYLKEVTRGQHVVAPESFETYLPLAAALGLAEDWVKFFQKQEQVPVPAWFQAMADGDAAWIAFIAATGATSSAGTSAASSAAGGAAGGGASGAS
jgi:hypothetical protein